jgi:hypothetical protein
MTDIFEIIREVLITDVSDISKILLREVGKGNCRISEISEISEIGQISQISESNATRDRSQRNGIMSYLVVDHFYHLVSTTVHFYMHQIVNESCGILEVE